MHPSHVKYFLRNNLDMMSEEGHNVTLDQVFKSCWGYENQCREHHRYKRISCPESSNHWTRTKREQEELFFSQGDFGYVRSIRKEIKSFCQPFHQTNQQSSFLECSSFTRFCRGRNLFIDFKNLPTIEQPMKYRTDVLADGMIGGTRCHLDKKSLALEGGHRSPLQSWFEEMEHFTVVDEMKCDIWIDRPTVLIKLDATINLYHHFCDFINLYLTNHVNNSWSLDRNMMIWDMSGYFGNFGSTWKAFTKHPILDLDQFAGKIVCFKDIIFSLLPRMVFGMYYNMPLVPGCQGSGVFHAFNRHILYHLGIVDSFDYLNDRKTIRATIISRKTKYRQIVNEEQLVETIKKFSSNFKVVISDFNHRMNFKDQLTIVANTDILIGIHGAGLTHGLFLPDYGVLFELFNCDDENCYKDLARLRGVKYMTWEDPKKVHPSGEGSHPTLGTHKKFINYSFDGEEFLRLVKIAATHVKRARSDFARSYLGLPMPEEDHDEL